MEIAQSARRHGVADQDILAAVSVPLRVVRQGGDRVLVIGADSAGRLGFWEQTQRRRGWHSGPVDAEHRTQRSIAERSPSLRLPRLLGPVQRVLRVSTLLYRGVPRLEVHDLVQRRGFLVRRVHLRTAAFDILPGRPGRVLLAAEHGRTVVQVELLRVWDTGGRSRTPAELDALAAAVGPAHAALLSALQLQATHLRSSFGPPERSPLAAYAGQSGTVLSEIADTIGGLP